MFKQFTDHPKSRGHTYLQHMFGAWKIIFLLNKLEIQCLIHSIFPFWYDTAVSSQIECLQQMVSRLQEENEEDLYEIYGGD